MVRAYISKRRRLLRGARIISAIIFLGPWRELLARYYQRRGKNKMLAVKSDSLFAELNVAAIISQLRQQGYAMGDLLAEDQINRILRFCSERGARHYANPHLDCEAINRIAYDPKIVDVARNHLGTEPILYRTHLYWTSPGWKGDKDRSSVSSEPDFHYDVGDFRSLAVFIYLTDVDEESGPHVVIEGTHNRKTPSQILSRYLSGKKAQEKFGDRIKVVTGPKGTMFFEEPTCWHKHSSGSKSRLMLAISYLLQRRPLCPTEPKEKTVCQNSTTTSSILSSTAPAGVASSSAK